jgi:hypothetical protein
MFGSGTINQKGGEDQEALRMIANAAHQAKMKNEPTDRTSHYRVDVYDADSRWDCRADAFSGAPQGRGFFGGIREEARPFGAPLNERKATRVR